MTNSRYVFFADFLGTKNRYSSPPLVLRSRQLLELTVDLFFLPMLEKFDMYLYIFSDTLVVTCPKLVDLIEPISNTFNRFLDFQDPNDNRTDLWLRAAISFGEVIESSHLHNNKRIRTIPFLDTSLPTAYSLESIRPGSRVFVDPKISKESFGQYQNSMIKWKQMTGRGEYAENVGEFLWPAKTQIDCNRLVDKTKKLYFKWRELLSKKSYDKSEYYESLIHLDETLKLFIRTCAVFCPRKLKYELFYSLFPKNNNDMIDFKYEWGIWFQALKGIIEDPNMTKKEIYILLKNFKIVKEILIVNDHYQHFLGELDFPDYNAFKKLYYQIGLNEI